MFEKFMWITLQTMPEWQDLEENILRLADIPQLQIRESKLYDEFLLLKSFIDGKIKKWNDEAVDVDMRWKEVFNHFNISSISSQNLLKLVEFIMCLPGTNAPTESLFSAMNNIWLSERTSLHITTLKAMLMFETIFAKLSNIRPPPKGALQNPPRKSKIPRIIISSPQALIPCTHSGPPSPIGMGIDDYSFKQSPPRVRMRTPSPKSMCHISEEASKIIHDLKSVLDEDSPLCEETFPNILDFDRNSDEEVSVPKTETPIDDSLSTNTKPSVSIPDDSECFVSTGETSSVFIENSLTSDDKENEQERKAVLPSKPVFNARALQKYSVPEKRVEKYPSLRYSSVMDNIKINVTTNKRVDQKQMLKRTTSRSAELIEDVSRMKINSFGDAVICSKPADDNSSDSVDECQVLEPANAPIGLSSEERKMDVDNHDVNENGESQHLQGTNPIIAKLPYDKPGAPGDPVVTEVGADFVNLSWEKPKSDGGSRIQGYWVEKREVGRVTLAWQGESPNMSITTQVNISNLIEDRQYGFEFRVFAVNAAGIGPPSMNSASVKITHPNESEKKTYKQEFETMKTQLCEALTAVEEGKRRINEFLENKSNYRKEVAELLKFNDKISEFLDKISNLSTEAELEKERYKQELETVTTKFSEAFTAVEDEQRRVNELHERKSNYENEIAELLRSSKELMAKISNQSTEAGSVTYKLELDILKTKLCEARTALKHEKRRVNELLKEFVDKISEKIKEGEKDVADSGNTILEFEKKFKEF